jgi:hypothetical protein
MLHSKNTTVFPLKPSILVVSHGKSPVIRAPARGPATSLEGRMTLGQACLEGGHLQQSSSIWVPLTQNVVGKSLQFS